MRDWQIDRRKRTRRLIELGGLVVKSGVAQLARDDRAMIYGAMLWITAKLGSDDGAHARDLWARMGKLAFEAERSAGAKDGAQSPPDEA